MAEVTMPRLSDTMEEGTIAAWLKKPGEQVNKGEVIAQIETDKATMDLTAFEAGTLQEILAPEGTTVQIGKPVARIGSGDAAPATQQAPPKSPADEPKPEPEASGSEPAAADEPEASDSEPPAVDEVAAQEAEAAVKEVVAEPSAPEPEPSAPEPAPQEESADGRAEANGKVRASPMARHMAAEHGLDLGAIKGTGPQGRVIRADIEAALASGPRPTEPEAAPVQAAGGDGDERVQLSQMRRTIARRMADSTRTVPHFFLTISVDATELVQLRKQVVEQLADDGLKVSINDLVVKAAALALRKSPRRERVVCRR
jgi:pyruvate dehydrogenase E2 component (dihydrolipoamide acetyltransferase)